MIGVARKDKVKIASKYLVPKKIEENGLDKKFVKFSQRSIRAIINDYTRESGVRNLESKDNVDLVFTSARFWTDGYISVGKRYDLANSVSPGNSATFTVICDDCYDDLFESPANNVIWTLMSGSDRICEFDLTKNKIENW